MGKTDLAEAAEADLTVRECETPRTRGSGPFVFARVRNKVGLDEIIGHVTHAWQHACAIEHRH